MMALGMGMEDSVAGSQCPATQDAGSAVVSVTIAFALLCCLCGYLAFLYLVAQEENSAQSAAAESASRQEAPSTKPPHGLDPSKALQPLPSVEEIKQQLAAEETLAVATPSQDTPRVQARHSSLKNSEDGTVSNAADLPATGSVGGRPPRSPAALKAGRPPLAAELPDGDHSYAWEDGSEYFGDWRGGQAEGRGVFSWPSGDRYEGEWESGRESGVGTLISSDGNTFYGFWSEGRMHGEGVFKPAAEGAERADVMFLRNYEHGRLVKETVLRVKDYDLHRKELKRDGRARKVEKRQAAREMAGVVARPGETIYKGHRSYDLMRNLQMGILFSIAKINREASARALATVPPDYKEQVSQQFPRSGQSTSFKWKDYCPTVFHELRQAFGIDDRDYLLSLTGDKALRELPSPGKSGSVFFISDDDRFMIKTVRKEEMRLLLELIPAYHAHCASNPDTLLTRFYGVHRVKPINGHHVRFLVMGNVFPTDTRLHRKFDLKGSTYGRTAGARRNDPSATLKDLDVDFRLQLGQAYHTRLMRQIEADAQLLERMHVMDYSLLLGIHYEDWEDDWQPPQPEHKDGEWREDGSADEWGMRRHVPPGTGPERDGGGDDGGTPKPSATGSLLPSPSSSMTSMSFASTAQASHASGTTVGLSPAAWSSPLRPSQMPQESRSERPLAGLASLAPPSIIATGTDDAGRVSMDAGSPTAPPRLLQLMSADKLRSETAAVGMNQLARTRSSWLRNQAMGLSMRSLHSEARKRLGTSIPALSFPLLQGKESADMDAKPEQVVLYFGIIDFLQDYNMRKRTEHMLKSIVQDGKTISVTNPHTYSQRFILHMQKLFMPASGS